MKKILIGILMSLMMVGMAFGAITNPLPLANTYINNVDSPNFLFSANSDNPFPGPIIYYYLNDVIQPTTLPCVAGLCQFSVDISGLLDNTAYTVKYQDINGIVQAGGNINIDNDPAKVTGLIVTPVSETELQLDWDDNTETDLSGYKVYEQTDGYTTPIAIVGTSDYLDNGLGLIEYCYKVLAYDARIGNEGVLSDAVCGTPQDMTPPADPTIVANPVEGSTTPIFNITYAEPVYNVKIYTGIAEFANLGNDVIAPYEFVWNPTLLPDAMYIFNIKAEDNNTNQGDYEFSYSTTDENASIIIGDEPPRYSNIITLNTTYDPNILNNNVSIDWTDDVGITQVVFDFEPTCGACGLPSGIMAWGGGMGTFVATWLIIPAGVYNYTWMATDTANQTNITSTQQFTINKAPPNIVLNVPSPVNEFSPVNVSCSSDTHTITLYRDGIALSGLTDTSILEYNSSNYLYECNVTENANYTSGSSSDTLTVLDNGPFSLFRSGPHPKPNAAPGKWVVLHYEIEMSGGDGAKARMNNLVSLVPPATININEDSEPVLICEEDYNGNPDTDPTTYLTTDKYYLVDNIYNVLDDAVYCTSERTADEIGVYNFILMIPIPVTAVAGNYNGNIYFQPYQS